MGKLPKPQSNFLQPDDVEDGDHVTIIGSLDIISREDSQFGREQRIVPVVLSSGEEKRWRINNTTYRELYDAWGDDDKDWQNMHIRIEKVKQKVRGKTRDVLYGHPYTEPQQKLPSPTPPQAQSLKEQLAALSPEEREALLTEMQ